MSYLDNNDMRLGLCCLSVGQHQTKFKTLRLTQARKHLDVVNYLHNVWNHNCVELSKVLEYCINQKIMHFRIGSSIFALGDHPEFNSIFKKFITSTNQSLLIARSTIRRFIDLGGRLSTHPDQFCVVSSNKEAVNANGILNLKYHQDFMQGLDIPLTRDFPINIHVSNGTLKDQAAINVRKTLGDDISQLFPSLVFETEDKNYWTWQRLREHFPEVPITLDYHHRLINNLGEEEVTAHAACVESWGSVKPLFHYSEGRTHPLDRAHSDYITKLPACATNIDIEIEAKMKDLAILKFKSKSI